MPLPPQGNKLPDYQTRGGFNTASIYSGALAPILTAAGPTVGTGPDIFLFSGPGRLNSIMPHNLNLSGTTAIVFYDAGLIAGAALTSGGPFVASGHKIVAIYPSTLATASGTVQPLPATPMAVDMVFTSGLCVNLKSGQPGFTVCFTPEVPNQ